MVWKSMLWRLWRDWGKPIVVVVVVLSALRSAVADWNDVPTGSMRPTILEGDRIFVNKLAYDLKVPFTTWHVAEWGNPARGDIVVCFSPEDGKRLVKRVIGLPGDRIELRNNRLLVNDQPVEYALLDAGAVDQLEAADRVGRIVATEKLDTRDHTVMLTPGVPARRNWGPTTAPEGQYVVFGDNRDFSADSRWFGFVPREQIVGRASRVVLSLDRERLWSPRWRRFMQGLD